MEKTLRLQGYSKEEDMLTLLINELASLFADRRIRNISKEDR